MGIIIFTWKPHFDAPMNRIVLIVVFLLSFSVHAQDLTVPEDILAELETVRVETETDTFLFRVDYPVNYDPNKNYPLLLGLSAGGQSREIVDYCFAAWFQSGYFREYITVMPVNIRRKNFIDYSPEEITAMGKAINANFPVTDEWIISGTSNGGIAAFNFVAAHPDWFKGVIVAPGTISEDITPNSDWSHLKVILAYGDKDAARWIKMSKESYKSLKKVVSSVQLVPLKGQGHILPISFNVDKIYDAYFLPQ